MVYFDSAATTKPNEEVIQEITNLMRGSWYNPSSVSEESRQVKLNIEHAREQIADYINCNPEEIIFTSGGSESNNLAIKGFYNNYNYNKPYGLFCSKGEHPSIYNIVKKYESEHYYSKIIPLDYKGQISLPVLEKYLKNIGETKMNIDHDVWWHPLVCVSYVNNEIGSINDIQTISKMVHEYHGYLLVDAVQAITHKKIDVRNMGIDMLSASFHKFGGVRGCGFLYVNKKINLDPLIIGGHQENNLRAGTEPSYLITAMGNRLEKLKNENEERLNYFNNMGTIIRNRLKEINGIKFNGENTAPHIISITIPNIPSNELISMMDIDGVIIAAGSACSSGENIPSRILKAIGLTDEEARSTIRISFDENINENDVDRLIESLKRNIYILRELHSDK